MAKRKVNKNNLLVLIGCILLVLALISAVVIFLLQRNSQSSGNTVRYQEVVVKDTDIPSEQTDKVESGIQNWAEATLGIDNSFSVDSQVKLRKQFYDSIFDEKQRLAIKNADDTFYTDANIVVNSVDVEVKEAKEAKSDNKDIGQVIGTITVSGTRNDEAFTRTYDVTLLVNYDKDVTSILQVRSIALQS